MECPLCCAGDVSEFINVSAGEATEEEEELMVARRLEKMRLLNQSFLLSAIGLIRGSHQVATPITRMQFQGATRYERSGNHTSALASC